MTKILLVRQGHVEGISPERFQERAALLALLRAEEIGITLSEEDQFDPEQSTSAIVVHHPRAKCFAV